MLKRKIRKGKIARKTEYEIAAALEVTYPSFNPLKKKTATSYRGVPSNPGRIIRRENLNPHTMIFRDKNHLFSRS
jgi:hypothetical protein